MPEFIFCASHCDSNGTEGTGVDVGRYKVGQVEEMVDDK